MRVGILELVRQPSRFASVGGALTLLVVLLVVLGGFLDGLELNQTGPYRAYEGQAFVFSAGSENLIQRSRIDAETAAQLDEAGSVASFGALNQIDSTASGPDGEVYDIVLFGYDQASDVLPAPPVDGAVVDQALADRNEIAVGDTLAVGPDSEPITVSAIVDDLSLGNPTVWVDNETWRAYVAAANPSALPPEGVNQALVVLGADGTDPTALAAGLNGITGLSSVTVDGAIEALPVVQQQSTTFEGIIGVTFIVTLMVVALFFALITLERIGLYAVLKALGATTRDLMAGISAQAVCISLAALLLGLAISFVFTQLIPVNLPVRVVPSRLVQIAVGVVLTSLLGSLFSLRRVLGIDPAESIG